MIRFLLRRLLHAAILLFVILTCTFFILRLAPGDPTLRYYGPGIDPTVMDSVRRALGFDRPLPVQYAKTMWAFLRGDFGISIAEHRPVTALLREAIPRTLLLAGLALVLQIAIGLALGAWSAVKRYAVTDRLFSVSFLVLYSVPTFYLAYLLIMLFSLQLGWLPSAGVKSIAMENSEGVAGFADRVRHLVLPVSVLALGSAAVFARYARGSLLDVASEEFVLTARAKGVSERHVWSRHVFRNALPQILTVVGLSVPVLLGGAVVVEKVFAWPGMGALVVDAIFARDYPVILATNFVGACMVILGSLVADISYVWVDPRIKLDGGS